MKSVPFGVAASQLSLFQAAQFASALTSLATGGGFDIIGVCASSHGSTACRWGLVSPRSICPA